MSQLMVYGANGYSGRQILQHAADLGLNPIAAGRDVGRIADVADAIGVPYRAFNLNRPDEVDAGLRDIHTVLNCAGPFIATAQPLLDGCIRHGVHYLDITGEFDVMESIAAQSDTLEAAGVMAVCGVAMDVVPSDCLAVHMANRLPSATRLDIFLHAVGTLSPGTTATLLRRFGLPNVVREDGQLVDKPAGADRRMVTFGGKELPSVGIPWGDISTAWHSTGIPNIATHATLGSQAPTIMRLTGFARPVLQSAPVQSALAKLAKRFVKGPDDAAQQRGKCEFVAEASDADGRLVRSHLRIPEGYAFTASTAPTIAQRVLNGAIKPGFQTPGTLLGADFVTELPGVTRQDLL